MMVSHFVNFFIPGLNRSVKSYSNPTDTTKLKAVLVKPHPIILCHELCCLAQTIGEIYNGFQYNPTGNHIML